MIGVGISPYNRRFISTGIPTQAEATALFDRATVLGSSFPDVDKPYVNSAIYYLKQTGQWTQLDSIGKFDVHSRIAALIDWKDPSRSFTTAGDYAGDFTAYSGFLGNNASFRIDTGLNFSTGTWNYTQNSAIKGLCINSNDTTASKIDLSAESALAAGISVFLSSATTPTTYSASNNGNDGISHKSFQRRGWHITKRTASNSYIFHKNGQTPNKTPKTTVSTAIPNLNINLLARNQAGVYSAFSPRRITGVFFGSGSCDAQYVVNGLNIWSRYSGTLATKAVIIDGNSFTQNGTYVDRFYSSYLASNTISDFTQGLSGIRTTEMVANFPTTIGRIRLDNYSNKVLFVWELTNEMYESGNDLDATYDSIVDYCNLARTTFGSDLKIIVGTCLPRKGSNAITPALRQNPLDLYDTTTLNGRIRTNYATFCDALADVASDATMGVDSGGVAGVGEMDTTYYTADQIHPTTVGYQYLADNYITPAINAYL